MERFFFFYLSNVISDRMPRVSDVYRAQGAPYEQYQANLAYIRNNPNLAYIGNRREYCCRRKGEKKAALKARVDHVPTAVVLFFVNTSTWYHSFFVSY